MCLDLLLFSTLSRHFGSSADIAALRWAYKKGRELIRRLPLFRGAFPPVAPEFAEDSPAAFKDTGAVEVSAPDIVYSAEDDKAIDEFHRKFGECQKTTGR